MGGGDRNIEINVKMASTTFLTSFFFLLLCAKVHTADITQSINSIPNPHMESSSSVGTCSSSDSGCPVLGALDVSTVLNSHAAIQSETFVSVVRKTLNGVEVFITFLISYHF